MMLGDGSGGGSAPYLPAVHTVGPQWHFCSGRTCRVGSRARLSNRAAGATFRARVLQV